MSNQTLVLGVEVDRWEQAIYAFLAEKERRSGSGRTVQVYSRMWEHYAFLTAKQKRSGAWWSEST
jgi:hypothetical protein